MRHLIRSMKTGEFYSNGKWVTGPTLALDFPDTASAVNLCLQRNLQSAEIVLQLGDEPDPKYDLTVPVTVDTFPPKLSPSQRL